MAKKELAPHGTVAAARRHQRADDPLCSECRVAWRDYQRDKRNGVETSSGPVTLSEPVSEVFELPSELEETRSNYRAVVAAMSSPSTPATALASLSARREALYERVLHLTEQRKLKDLVESIPNGPDAAEAVRAAGGSALDALLARAQADHRPVKRRSDRVGLDPVPADDE